MAKITIDQYNTLMTEEMPWAVEAGMTLESIGADRATMRLAFNDAMLRPGGTMSGPTMMALADATVVLPFNFSRLIWAALFGFIAFAEVPDLWTWVGGLVIFASSIYITRFGMRRNPPV